MILPVYLSEKKHADIICRLETEANKSAVVQVALTSYYAKQDASDDLLLQLAAQVAKLDADVVRLCELLEGG